MLRLKSSIRPRKQETKEGQNNATTNSAYGSFGCLRHSDEHTKNGMAAKERRFRHDFRRAIKDISAERVTFTGAIGRKAERIQTGDGICPEFCLRAFVRAGCAVPDKEIFCPERAGQ